MDTLSAAHFCHLGDPIQTWRRLLWLRHWSGQGSNEGRRGGKYHIKEVIMISRIIAKSDMYVRKNIILPITLHHQLYIYVLRTYHGYPNHQARRHITAVHKDVCGTLRALLNQVTGRFVYSRSCKHSTIRLCDKLISPPKASRI